MVNQFDTGPDRIGDYAGNLRPRQACIAESDVRATLTRILESADFSQCRRARSFLRFVVEEKLSGRGNRLKAFAVAREVYGRDETFDPRTDTIVRVEAGRLRHRLENYYKTAGRDDPVRIDLPKGGYTPTFNLSEDVASNTQPQPATRLPAAVRQPNRHSFMRCGTVALALILYLAGGIFFVQDRQTASNDSVVMREAPSRAATALLIVLPLLTLDENPGEDRLAAGLLEAIVTDLAKLPGLSVMAHVSLLNPDSPVADLDQIRREFGATHALRGSLERGEGDLIRVNIQLIDIAKHAIIWADRLDAEVQDPLALQDVLASRIVDALAVEFSPEEQIRIGQLHPNQP